MAHALASKPRAGTVRINCYNVSARPAVLAGRACCRGDSSRRYEVL